MFTDFMRDDQGQPMTEEACHHERMAAFEAAATTSDLDPSDKAAVQVIFERELATNLATVAERYKAGRRDDFERIRVARKRLLDRRMVDRRAGFFLDHSSVAISQVYLQQLGATGEN